MYLLDFQWFDYTNVSLKFYFCMYIVATLFYCLSNNIFLNNQIKKLGLVFILIFIFYLSIAFFQWLLVMNLGICTPCHPKTRKSTNSRLFSSESAAVGIAELASNTATTMVFNLGRECIYNGSLSGFKKPHSAK